MLYRVTKSYAGRPEQEVQRFKTIHSAKEFISDEIESAILMKIHLIFRIYEGVDLMETYDSTKPHPELKKAEAGSESGSKGSGASFRPTPFNTAPTPGGLPKRWLKDAEDEEDDKTK